MREVELEAVSIRHGDKLALDHASLTVAAGTLVVLIGMSGSGKTSILRAIAGLDDLASGAVRIGGRDMRGVEPGERDVSMTFQRPALLTTRSVGRNISFPLELRRATAEAIAERVGVEARAMHIEHLLDRDVGTLSVGEAQMVQVARAIVRTPTVLLLDEPFAALEGERIHVLRREVRLLQQRFGVTTVMSTNDPQDAMAIADRLVVLEQGRIVQCGTARQVYDFPDTAIAAQLLGPAVIEPALIDVDADGAWIRHDAFRFRAWQPALRRHAGRRVQLVTRPDWWEIEPHGRISATVRRVRPTFGGFELSCDVDGHRVTVAPSGAARPPEGVTRGSRIGLRLRHWVVLDPLDGRRIRLED